MADQFFVNLQTHLAPEAENAGEDGAEDGGEEGEGKKGWFKKMTGG
jgi:hypothetical protein